MTPPIKSCLLKNGYFGIREIPGQGICALQHLMFTKAVVCGLTEVSYRYRYCYHTLGEAIDAINSWDGEGDPPGNWIKRKGEGGDKPNKKYKDGRRVKTSWEVVR